MNANQIMLIVNVAVCAFNAWMYGRNDRLIDKAEEIARMQMDTMLKQEETRQLLASRPGL